MAEQIQVEDRIQFYTRIDPELAGALDVIAADLGISRADLFRLALKKYADSYDYVTPWYTEEG